MPHPLHSPQLPIALPLINEFVGDAASWQRRWAGVRALSLLGEHCAAALGPHAPAAIALLGRMCADPHPRVVYQAVHCVGQLAHDLGQIKLPRRFPELGAATLLPGLLRAMDAGQPMRNRAHACEALTHFADPSVSSSAALRPMLAALVTRLGELMHGTPVAVQERALTALSMTAVLMGDEFAPFYPACMGLAKQIMHHATDDVRCRRRRIHADRRHPRSPLPTPTPTPSRCACSVARRGSMWACSAARCRLRCSGRTRTRRCE